MQATASRPSDIVARTSLGWQRRNLKIVNKKSKVVSLHHNIAQLKTYNTKRLQKENGFPVRIIICKARQMGLSTGEEADMFEDVNRKPNRHGCVISADTDSTNKVFNMCRTFQQELPGDVRRQTRHSNRKEISYTVPHRSSILCQTAGKDVLGRGGTTHKVHATEVAFWARAEKQLFGMLQEVPLEPDTSVAIESTAFGTTGEFHDRFWNAVDRIRSCPTDYNGYLPVFLPWHIFPEYQMAVPANYHLDPYGDHEVYGDEKQLLTKYSCSPEQLYWRRYKIDNDFKKDLPRFMQEYPATARESFQGTGRLVFIPSAVDALERHCKKPVANVEFYRDDSGDVRYRNVHRRQNCWSIWKWPQSNHDYACFGDVAEGLLADPSNPRSDPDRSVSIVLDRTSFDLPAVYYGRPDTIEFGDQMLMGAEFFRMAWSSPEMNSIGQSVLDTFKRAEYPYIYQREHKEETDVEEDSSFLGWKTTVKTRKPMIADLITVVNEGELHVYDQRIIDEARSFVHDKNGKPCADTGRHDDCIMSLAGVIQLHQRCPYGDDDYEFLNKPAKEKATVPVAGEYDDDDDDEDTGYSEILYEDMSDYE